MTTRTGGAGHIEIAADVAGRAVQRGVHPGQGKAGELGVVEIRSQPTVHGVAGLAGGRKSRGLVIREFGLRERLRVAGDAICGKPLELAGARALVTIVAGERGVCADQGETVLVCAEVLKARLPAANRVALFAVRAELAPMDVGVAIRALGSRLGEDQADMALRTGYSLVKASQRITSFVVVKLEDVAQRFPGREGVAILTRDVQIAVRTARDVQGSPLCGTGCRRESEAGA